MRNKAVIAVAKHNLAGDQILWAIPVYCENVAWPNCGEHADSGDFKTYLAGEANHFRHQAAFGDVAEIASCVH
jgi:hypothetical protein